MMIEYYNFGMKYPALQDKIFKQYLLFNTSHRGTVQSINEMVLQDNRENILLDVKHLLEKYTPSQLEKMNTLETLRQTSLNGDILREI